MPMGLAFIVPGEPRGKGRPRFSNGRTYTEMESGDLLPTRKPDVDNIIKAVLDALNGVGYKDDASVVEVSCRKLYGTLPRVEVEIMGEVLV